MKFDFFFFVIKNVEKLTVRCIALNHILFETICFEQRGQWKK